MQELVVVSGKGGTGKTSITASFALLADTPVLADCDVDAADLHLILEPRKTQSHVFYSGREAAIRQQDCTGCGLCKEYCRFDAVLCDATSGLGPIYTIDPVACEGCGVCVQFCPQKAIDFPERLCGEWLVSQCRSGPMVHARLGVAAENSGKLVSTVRREARRLADQQGRSLILVDGPPGISCPVIASVTGASKVLIVTEPTVSGAHDMSRVLSLTRHFDLPAAVCINKWDINPEMANHIEGLAIEQGAVVAGRIRYDNGVTQAQIQAKAVVETASPCAEDIRRIWQELVL